MLNLDTHIVVRLLQDELQPAEKAALSGEGVGISAMVLWELAKLRQLGRIQIGLDDPRVQAFLDECRVWPLDAAVAHASTRLDFRSDPADEIIAATSVVHRIPLLTRDERLLASKVVPLARLG